MLVVNSSQYKNYLTIFQYVATKMDKIVKKSFIPLLMYGFARKTIQMWNASVETLVHDKEQKELVYKQRPLLCVEKGAVILSSTLLTPALFPMYVYKDLKNMEMKIRRIESTEGSTMWSRNTCVADHLFK